MKIKETVTMEEMLTTVSSTSDGELTIASALIAMGVSIAFGLVIALTYTLTHSGRHQQSFTVTLTMLPVIIAVIILFVGSNVARAFSLAGTLSIIRFRSAPGDPKDIAYIFFSIAAGLACGVGLYFYGGLFVVVLCLFMFVLTKTNFGANKDLDRVLKITVPEDLDYPGAFDDVFEHYTARFSLSRMRTTDLGSLYELCYDVTMKKDADEKSFVDELRCRNGNLNIALGVAVETVYGK